MRPDPRFGGEIYSNGLLSPDKVWLLADLPAPSKVKPGTQVYTTDASLQVSDGVSWGSVSPAILRGSYDISRYPGVTVGVVDAATRIANGVALQAALDYCATNRKFADVSDVTLQYTASGVQESRNVGLQVKKDVLGLVGAKAKLIQYATNHPALTLGDAGSVSGDLSSFCEYRGFSVGYGSSQVGQTSADGLLIGRMANCKLDQINVDRYISGSLFVPYVGIRQGPAATNFFFSNQIGTLSANGGQKNLLWVLGSSTGNRVENMYLGGGTFGSRNACSDKPVRFSQYESTWGSVGQMNIEWQDTDQLMFADGQNMVIDLLHVEGNKMNGNDSCYFNVVGRTFYVDILEAVDNWVAAPASTGSLALFTSYGRTSIDVRKADLIWHGSGYNAEAVATASQRIFKDDTSASDKSRCVVRNLALTGNTGTFDFDAGTTAANYGAFTSCGLYEYNPIRSRVEEAEILLPSGNGAVTGYGATRHTWVKLDTSISADRKYILNANLSPSGKGSTTPRIAGDSITFYRSGNATGAFNWLIRDSADATTLATLATAGLTATLVWTGSAWA